MKKFYSLILAVAATSMVAVAGPQKAAARIDAPVKMGAVEAASVTMSAPVAKATKTLNKTTMAKAMAKAGETVPEVEVGKYFMMGYLATESFAVLDCEIAAGEGTGNYILTTQMDETAQIPCTASYKAFSDGTSTYNFPVLTIEGQGKYTLYTQNGVDYKIWATGLSDGQFARYRDDIDLLVFPGGELIPLYTDFGMGWFNSDNRGNGFVSDFKLYVENASMAWTETSNTTTEEESPMHVYVDATDCKIYMVGLYGYFNEVVFDINAEEDNISATDLVLTTFTGEDNKTHALNLTTGIASAEGTSIYNLAMFEIDEENGKTYLVGVSDQYLYCLEENDEDGNGYGGWYYKFTNSEIELNFSLAAGVKDVTVAGAEVDLNAPVEYYNLQGVRVAEPAAGLYIRRQGNAVSKVIIR